MNQLVPCIAMGACMALSGLFAFLMLKKKNRDFAFWVAFGVHIFVFLLYAMMFPFALFGMTASN